MPQNIIVIVYGFMVTAITLFKYSYSQTNESQIPTLSSLQSLLSSEQGWFPGQVRLASFGRDNFNSVLVGGGWVLTGASVFRNNYNPLMWSALVARDALSPGQTTIHVQSIFIYGGYHDNSDNNDIALVKLQDDQNFLPDLNLQTKIRASPVNLPSQLQMIHDQTCFLVGWADNQSGLSRPQDLRTTPVTLMNASQCSLQFGLDSVSPGQLCLASDNIDDGPCQGDQGSPVLCQVGNFWTVVGIASDLFGCGAARETTADNNTTSTTISTAARRGTFTDVSHYLPWINKIMLTF